MRIQILRDKLRMICNAQGCQGSNKNLRFDAMCCRHDPFFIEECATTVEPSIPSLLGRSVAQPNFLRPEANLPTDLTFCSILASNDPILRGVIPIGYP